MKKNWCILITIVNLLLLGFVIWVLCTDSGVKFTGDNITTILGVLVSCISIVITIIFVVLAINAYGRIKEIDKNADVVKERAQKVEKDTATAEKKVHEIEESHDLAIQSLKDIGAATKSSLENALSFIELVSPSIKNKNLTERYKVWRKRVEGSLYRLSLHRYLLDEGTRISFLLNLSAFGNKTDIEQLERISNSEQESPIIRRTAKIVLEELLKKYPQSST